MPQTLPTVPLSFDLMMPFYGDPALFRLAVESILGQTDPGWRLVVIDDQYPDLGQDAGWRAWMTRASAISVTRAIWG